MTGSDFLIDIQALNKTYPLDRARKKVVFSDLRLQIRQREFVAFLGPSGCGKSTLLRLIAGLEPPTLGQILTKTDQFSVVFQEPRLLPWLTVKENVLLPTELGQNKPSAKQRPTVKETASHRADQQLVSLGLSEFSSQFPAQLSGGMKMRTALARALLLDPGLLLLDEPLAALDEQTRARLQTELRSLYENSQMTFVFVTHSIREACFLADRIFIFPPSPAVSSTSAGPLQPLEVTVDLPPQRTAELRDSQAFFEETKRVTALFHQVVGA
jgi:NitT/TauT family transport system ATP-binding protein